MVNENRDFAPVILKFGVALALSFGGVIYSLIINKRSKDSQSRNDLRSCSYRDEQVNSRSNRLCFDPLATDKHEQLHQLTNTECVKANSASPKGYSRAEKDTHEQEIKSLKNAIKILKERESTLEIKLLEYYGLKEQETIVMELQNRLKLNSMEAKFYTLKIKALQADNRKLEAQMTDYKKVVANLETARAKIKILKRKLQSKYEQHKKQILDFHQRVQKMQDDENKHVVKIDPQIEPKLCKLKELEAEVAELRTLNHDLQLEKAELAHKLDCVQILATSVLEDGESKKIKEENQTLKKQNKDLSKQMEQLQADRCGDIEQLVYLRWINACLRYELRNYQPALGKKTARDLSKTLSPASEHKVKQMIVEYANKEDAGEIESQASVITDSDEFDECVIGDSLCRKKHKFFRKLMRVLKKKDPRNSSGGEEVNFCWLPDRRLRSSSLGSKKLMHRHSASGFYNQIGSIEGDVGGGGGHRRWSCSASTGGERSELVKYAEALKDSRPILDVKCYRRSPSLTLF